MLTKTNLLVRPANTQDRSKLANIFQFETKVHRHLDWRPPLEWLGKEPYFIAEKNGRVVAALATPPDPPGISWIRIFATSKNLTPSEAWNLLWDETKEKLIELETSLIAAIPLQSWFLDVLMENNFEEDHKVIVLSCEANQQNLPKANPIQIRPMTIEDLPEVQALDSASFGSIWQNSIKGLETAYNLSVVSTVVFDDQGITGYQITTPSPYGAHLGRLAVHPRAQGKGIGYSLIRYIQQQFEDLSASKLSVNTQSNNLASLKLYEKAGFELTKEAYPVYLKNLN
jgi:ribosomal protein S18 acetylase RimI-like enzyme